MATSDKIIFPKKINVSVQAGDELYYSDVSSGTPAAPISLGQIIERGDNWVRIVGPAPSVYHNKYFMFNKLEHNNYTNISSLKGYYAEVEFSNNSTNKQELFTVGSEITISSK